MSACGARGGAEDRPDVGEHAAGVPGWEGPYQRRRAVELDRSQFFKRICPLWVKSRHLRRKITAAPLILLLALFTRNLKRF